jgi:hypothetical protein
MGSINGHIVRTILGAAPLIPVRFIGIATSVISASVLVIAPAAFVLGRLVRPDFGGLLYREDG